jgi:hypothetical protein
MFAKTFNGETRKLYITKAGLQVGEEKYIKEETREGISLKVHTVYSTGGKKEEQESQLLLDRDYNTLKMEVIQDSSSIYQRYSFTYKNSEAHFRVDQESRISNWEGKKIDQAVVWENKCLVIPGNNAFILFKLLLKKYSFASKGKQNVGCALVPKMLFSLEYLGEDMVKVDNNSQSCQRFQITSSVGETTADMWINESEDIFKLIFRDYMVTIQSWELQF